MVFRLVVLIALMVGASGSEECSCPAKKGSDQQITAGKCRNRNGSNREYLTVTVPSSFNTNKMSGQEYCDNLCKGEDDCLGWAHRWDGNDGFQEANCLLYSYEPDRVQRGSNNKHADWECYAKGTGTLLDRFSFQFLGDGLCNPSSEYTQVRAYRGGKIDDQNPLGTIESIEQCQEFCDNNVDIEEYFFFEPGDKCMGFNFLPDRCKNSAGEVKSRCSTNCFLQGEAPPGNRTRESRKRNYDGWECYVRKQDCDCD